MAGSRKLFYECVASVCLTFGTIFLFIELFLAIGFLMGVMNISVALPIASQLPSSWQDNV